MTWWQGPRWLELSGIERGHQGCGCMGVYKRLSTMSGSGGFPSYVLHNYQSQPDLTRVDISSRASDTTSGGLDHDTRWRCGPGLVGAW
jgi:hypothetical protein